MHGAFSYPYFHQGLNKTHTERDVRDQQAFELHKLIFVTILKFPA